MTDLTPTAATASRPRYALTPCQGCAVRFHPTHHRQSFHSTDCQSAYRTREKVRGQKIALIAQAWRLGRNAKGKSADALKLKARASDAFTDLCRLLDEFNAEDTAAGRPNALVTLGQQYAMNRRG